MLNSCFCISQYTICRRLCKTTGFSSGCYRFDCWSENWQSLSRRFVGSFCPYRRYYHEFFSLYGNATERYSFRVSADGIVYRDWSFSCFFSSVL